MIPAVMLWALVLTGPQLNEWTNDHTWIWATEGTQEQCERLAKAANEAGAHGARCVPVFGDVAK